MTKTTVALHQPNFLPYLGFFDKLKKADLFVIRDEVLFVEKDYHQRNKIRINGNDNLNNPQSKWIKVPVVEEYDYIKCIKIKRDVVRQSLPWNARLIHEISASYNGAPYFNQYFPELKKIVDNSDEKLLSLNIKLIRFLMHSFDIKTKVIMASDLGLKGEHYQKSDASEDIVEICKAVGADVYLSGQGGANYLNLEPFKKEGIGVEFQKYDHPVYRQRFPGFVPFMSAIDALFCVGGVPEAGQN